MLKPIRRWMRHHPEHMPAVWAAMLFGGGTILVLAFVLANAR